MDGGRQDRGVDIFEIGDVDGIAEGLIGARGDREIDRGDAARGVEDQTVVPGSAVDADLGPMIMDGVRARSRVDDVGSPAAVDRVVARAAGEDIGAGRAGDRDACEQRGGVDILEIDDEGRIAGGLVGGVGEIDIRRRVEDERVVPRPAVDGDLGAMVMNDVVAGPRVDHIGAAAPVDGVVARTGRDDVGARRTRDLQRAGQ